MGDVTRFVRPLPRGAYRLLDNITFNVGRLAGSYNRSAARFYPRRFGLSVPEVRVLNVVGHHEPVAAADVAETSLMDKGLVSRAVAKLTKIGLVARAGDDGDGRRRILTLTEAGRRTWSAVLDAKQRRHDRFLGTLTAVEIDQFLGLLERLRAEAERIEGDEAMEEGGACAGPRGPDPGARVAPRS